MTTIKIQSIFLQFTYLLNFTGTSKRPKMVGHSVDLSEVRDSTSVRTYARCGRGLATFTRRSIMGMVVTCNFAIGTAAAGGYFGHY